MSGRRKICSDTQDVVEVRGACRVCGQEALLGDGLCVSCWDKEADKETRIHTIPKKLFELDGLVRDYAESLSAPKKLRYCKR